MRLLYITDRLSYRGGAPHHLLDLIHQVADEHELTVAAADRDSDVELPRTVRFVRCRAIRSGRELEESALPALVEAADGVHLQNVMQPAVLSAVTGPKTIVTVQDHRVFCPGPGKTLPSGQACDDPMGPAVCGVCISDKAERAERLALTSARLEAIKQAGRVVVLSHYMAGALHQLGVHPVEVIPPPVPLGPQRTAAGEGFLVAGRLVHHKGTDIAVEAFRVASPSSSLSVAGLGPVELGNAQALGWLDRPTLRAHLAQARALLFPARWQEPFGIVGVEALAMGTPVVAMVRGGMVDWADVGTLAVSGVDEMAASISYLQHHPEEALSLGREGQLAVAKRFSPRDHFRRVLALYQGL